jgi:hypothetical protein
MEAYRQFARSLVNPSGSSPGLELPPLLSPEPPDADGPDKATARAGMPLTPQPGPRDNVATSTIRVRSDESSTSENSVRCTGVRPVDDTRARSRSDVCERGLTHGGVRRVSREPVDTKPRPHERHEEPHADGKPTDVSSVPPAFGFAGAPSPAPIRQPPAAFLVGDVGFASAGGLSAASPPRSPAPSGNPTSSTEFLVGGDSQELSTSDGGGGADVVSPPAAPVPRGLASPGDSVIGGGVVSWSTAPAQGPASAGGDDGGDVVTTLDRHEPSPWPPDAPAGNASKELSANDGGGSVGVMPPSAAPAVSRVEARGSASQDQAHPLAQTGAASPFWEAAPVAAASTFGGESESPVAAEAWLIVAELEAPLLAATHKTKRRRNSLLGALDAAIAAIFTVVEKEGATQGQAQPSSQPPMTGQCLQESPASDGGGSVGVVSPSTDPVPRGPTSPSVGGVGVGVVSYSAAHVHGPASASNVDGGVVITALGRHELLPWPPDAPAPPVQGPASAGDDGGGVVITALGHHDPLPWPPDASSGSAPRELSASDGGGIVGIVPAQASPAPCGSASPDDGDVGVGTVSHSAAPTPATPRVGVRRNARSPDQAQPSAQPPMRSSEQLLAQPSITNSAHPLAQTGAASPYGEAVLVAGVSLFGDETESTAVATAWLTVTALEASLLAEKHKEQVRRQSNLLDTLGVAHVRRWGGRLTARTDARDLEPSSWPPDAPACIVSRESTLPHPDKWLTINVGKLGVSTLGGSKSTSASYSGSGLLCPRLPPRLSRITCAALRDFPSYLS